MKTVVIVRDGNLAVGDHLTELRAWLSERSITPLELLSLHVLNFRVVFRARFETDAEADRFVEKLG